jgi:threonine/homoserine/homoserine lactone efflux protein
MTLIQLTLAALALLATPGPTNALLALAGAQSGLRLGLRLIPVVLLCYLAVVAPLLLWGGPVLDKLPLLRPILAGAAALWVARLAYRLWNLAPLNDGAAPPVSPSQIAITTLLNPKSLIFGLVLLPSHQPIWASLVAFLCLLPIVSALWIGLGAKLFSRSGQWLNKGSALWLAALSVMLAAKAFAG